MPLGDPAPQDGLLPKQSSLGVESRTFHAYVHIPFCDVICGYCDFNTYTSSDLAGASKSEYAKLVIAEISQSAEVLKKSGLPARALSSVFFGGGTPTQLPAEDLVSILSTLRETFDFVPGIEITSEANPDSVDLEYLEKLAEGGFNRISLGMQSNVPEVLATLERTHNPSKVPEVIAAAKAVGLKTSVDLIYGAPGESIDQWESSILAAIALEPDHISAYALIIEEGTKLARQIRSGELPDVDEDVQADKYELADKLLSAAGYQWYEISNWSKSAPASMPGNQSSHNFAYWLSQDWWGFGPGAHSHIGGVRWWNVKHPTAYSSKISQGISPALARETLDERTRLEERVLLEIRIEDGLTVDLIQELSPSAVGYIDDFVSDGLVEKNELGRIVLTLKGRLLADSLVRQLTSA
jgi:oxygen-independent coproporphyrinogen-3 oxidase